MSINVACDHCGKRYSVAETATGKRVKCKSCGNPFVVAPLATPAPVRSDATPPPLPPRTAPVVSRNVYSANVSISPPLEPNPAPTGVTGILKNVHPAVWLSAGIALLVILGFAVVLLIGPNKSGSSVSNDPYAPLLGHHSFTGPQEPSAPEPVPSPESYHFPPRPPMLTLRSGTKALNVQLKGNGPAANTQLYLYLPKGLHEAKSLPCVFIAPAGSHCIDGIALNAGDRAEHTPYIDAGFAVIAYSLDGAAPGGTQKYTDMIPNIVPFMAAHGGMDNARTAIAYALTQMPEIDPDRLYTAGHSSAATIALDLTAVDPRIKACCSYCPATDLRQRTPPPVVRYLDSKIPGFDRFITDASPSSHVSALQGKPVLLFTAEDDTNVSPQLVKDFAATLKSTGGAKIQLVVAASGGHYQSMIREGIPAGIQFLKQVDGRMSK